MHLHIQALREALDEMGVRYSGVSGFPDALIVGGNPFIRSTTPFNTEGVSFLCRDKMAVYELVKKSVRIPKTEAFLDPFGRHPELVEAKTIDEIVSKTLDFLYPRMVKMNRGGAGRNVFAAKDDGEFRSGLDRIFDKSSRDYDYIALVQEYIEPAAEYRVAIANGRAAFAYDRGTFELASGGAEAKLLRDGESALSALSLSWGSVDFIESKTGELYFIEANTRPSHEGFIMKNGNSAVKSLYAEAVRNFSHGSGAQTLPQIDPLGAHLRRFSRVPRIFGKEA